jgi:hypothetical protein
MDGVKVPKIRTEQRGDKWIGIIRHTANGATEWEIGEHAARMIEMARQEGYENAKAQLRQWLSPKGGPV